MKIDFLEKEKQWEKTCLQFRPNTFLQSWAWGEFYRSLGQKIFRLGFWENKKLIGLALLIKEEAKRGVYLACPGGPLLDWSKPSRFADFVAFVRRLGKEEKALFCRVRPSCLQVPENELLFRRQGFFDAPMHMHAETTWQLDLDPSEDELLKKMRKTTRYEIRRALKEGIEVLQTKDPAWLETLYDLQLETARRHHFVPFGHDFLQKQFVAFSARDQAVLFVARYRKEIAAVSMIVFYGDTAVYHYSGSATRWQKLPSSYLIQWEALREAKRRGCRHYNFWGIAPDGQPHHRFAGVTTFKKGFGGYPLNFLHAQDLPLSPFYWPVFLFETARRRLRKL